MSKKRVELHQNEIDLLKFSAGDLIPELSKSVESLEVKMAAYRYWNSETEEEFQVQVIVTRDKSEFIEDFSNNTYTTMEGLLKVKLIRIELDFLWSIRLGACLRIYSYDKPYVYKWKTWSRCGQHLNNYGKVDKTPCPDLCPCYLNQEREFNHTRTIPCGPGQLVLGNPRTEGRSDFWTRSPKRNTRTDRCR